MIKTAGILVLSTLTVFSAQGGEGPTFTDGDLAKWLAILAFLLVTVDRAGAVWDRFVKQKPSPEELEGRLRLVLERAQVEHSESLNVAIQRLTEEFRRESARLDTDLTRAAVGRKEIYRQIESLAVSCAQLREAVDTLKQQHALAALAKRQTPP